VIAVRLMMVLLVALLLPCLARSAPYLPRSRPVRTLSKKSLTGSWRLYYKNDRTWWLFVLRPDGRMRAENKHARYVGRWEVRTEEYVGARLILSGNVEGEENNFFAWTLYLEPGKNGTWTEDSTVLIPIRWNRP
jgi:hypothetical protein